MQDLHILKSTAEESETSVVQVLNPVVQNKRK